MALHVQNVQIIVLFVKIYLNACNVQLAIKSQRSRLLAKQLKHVMKFVVMELNTKLNAMTEILTMEMVAVASVRFNQDGVVVGVPQHKKVNVTNIFLIKLSLLKKEL